LLAFGRQQVLQPRVTPLSRVVDELLPMLRRLVSERIDIRRASDGADESIFADVTQLEQIVLNLTINASDAMSGGGTLVLRTGAVDLEEPLDASHLQVAPGRYAFLEVKDTGEGMDAETHRRIFEPFFTTKPSGGGTGLGLSTVYGIVKQMRGGIWVYSEPGSGSTFRIYLPRHDGDPRGEPKEAAAAPPPVVGGTETLLLVEDENAVRTFARRMLERYGYRVLSAANPSDALALCSDPGLEIDLVLTDVRMPGGTGPELVDTLQRQRPALRAMFMSGYNDLPDALTGAPGDPRYFLAKPFAGAELAAKVRAILDEERP
jgi:CheY-like chemotaxis protein